MPDTIRLPQQYTYPQPISNTQAIELPTPVEEEGREYINEDVGVESQVANMANPASGHKASVGTRLHALGS